MLINKILMKLFHKSSSLVRDSKGRFGKGNQSGKLFQKGETPWNKGKYGYMGRNSTSFTKEEVEEKGKKGEGVPKISKGNHLVCSCSERKPVVQKNGKVYQTRKRISYARYVLEQNGVVVPKGAVIWHKDGDFQNNELSNLEIITRAELCKRNCGGK